MNLLCITTISIIRYFYAENRCCTAHLKKYISLELNKDSMLEKCYTFIMMMKKTYAIYFKGEPIDLFNQADIEATLRMLKKAGFDSERVTKDGKVYTGIIVNEARYKNQTTRKAGRRSHLRKPESFVEVNPNDPELISVEEIRKSIRLHGAIYTAVLLNISKSALYSMLRKAIEDDELWVK